MNAAALQEARRERLAQEAAAAEAAVEQEKAEEQESEDVEGEEAPQSSDEESENDDHFEDASDDELLDDADLSHYFSAEEDTPDGQDPRARVLSVLELEDLFLRTAPDLSGEMNTPLVLQPIFNVPSLQSSRTHLETIQQNSSLAWLVTLTLENPAPSTP